MHDITPDAVVIGIDTHKDVHVAVAINGLGARLATASFPVTSKGYRQVAAWATEGSVANIGDGRAASPRLGIRQHWQNAD
jgi:hypothetical protein